TVAFGSIWLAPRMGEFADEYPEIEAHLILHDDELDLGMRDADVAIRMYPPHQPDLVSRLVFEIHTQVYAAPAYIAKRGAPMTVDDLKSHRLVIYGGDAKPPIPQINWLSDLCADAGSAACQTLMVNNIYGIARAVRAGVGIAALPSYVAADAPDLVRVLTDLEGPKVSAHFVYAEEMRNSRRISAFRDFVLRKVAEGAAA
ncbi:MAG: substrate binding domain-containing protein, partial [Pseudomonadota bacterium]